MPETRKDNGHKSHDTVHDTRYASLYCTSTVDYGRSTGLYYTGSFIDQWRSDDSLAYLVRTNCKLYAHMAIGLDVVIFC